MSYQHILIASGGAKHSRKAEKRAVDLAKACGSKLTLVSVVRASIPVSNYGIGLDMGTNMYSDLLYDQKKDQEDILKKASKRCTQHGFTPETLLLSGTAGEQIVEAAKAQGCDLIVVGSRQLSLMGTLAQGSVSDYVMRHAPCDVLIAR